MDLVRQSIIVSCLVSTQFLFEALGQVDNNKELWKLVFTVHELALFKLSQPTILVSFCSHSQSLACIRNGPIGNTKACLNILNAFRVGLSSWVGIDSRYTPWEGMCMLLLARGADWVGWTWGLLQADSAYSASVLTLFRLGAPSGTCKTFCLEHWIHHVFRLDWFLVLGRALNRYPWAHFSYWLYVLKWEVRSGASLNQNWLI